MATEETGLLDKQDFLEQKDVIKKQILGNGKLTGAQKRQTLQVLAAYTVAESQIESLVTAKGYADCVVFMGAESVSVVVAPPEGGLTATDAARIKDIVISETDYTAQQIKIMEAN